MTHWPVSGACFWYQSTGTRNWSVCHTRLVPDFSGARNRRRIEHVQFRARNQLKSWTVIAFSSGFFNSLNAKTAAVTSSFSKLSKSESIMCFPRWYHLPAKCVMVSDTRQLAPVSSARNRRRKQAPENGQCVINLRRRRDSTWLSLSRVVNWPLNCFTNNHRQRNRSTGACCWSCHAIVPWTHGWTL